MLSFDPANVTAGFTPVIDFPLDQPRQNAAGGFNWRPWLDVWAETSDPNVNAIWVHPSDPNVRRYPQPILSDIEFDPSGQLLIGFRDRAGDQLGINNYRAISGDRNNGIYVSAKGDLLKACLVGGAYVIEGGDPSCPIISSGSYGVSGNGEFFSDLGGDASVEALEGGLAVLSGSGEVVSTIVDPFPPGGTTGSQYFATQGS